MYLSNNRLRAVKAGSRRYSPLGFSGEMRNAEPTEQQLLARSAHGQNLRNIAAAQVVANATGQPAPVRLLSPVNDAGQLTVGASLPQATDLISRPGILTTNVYGAVETVAPISPIPSAPPNIESPTVTQSAPIPPPSDNSPATSTPTGGSSTPAGSTGIPDFSYPGALTPPIDISVTTPIQPTNGGESGTETVTLQTAGNNAPWILGAVAVAVYFLTRKKRV